MFTRCAIKKHNILIKRHAELLPARKPSFASRHATLRRAHMRKKLDNKATFQNPVEKRHATKLMHHAYRKLRRNSTHQCSKRRQITMHAHTFKGVENAIGIGETP